MTPDLARLTWTDVPDGPLVLVPLGSFEQHGPHLPLDTDTRIADAVAHAVAARLPGEVVVAPPVVYAASGEHQGFPGTVSIGNEALRLVLVELVRSLTLWSGRVVLLNGHGGNAGCLADAVRRLVAEGQDVVHVPCSPAGGDAHAGHTETSLMLHLAPELVHMDRAWRGNPTPIRELMPALVAGGVAAVSASGVLGDPTTATAEEGARLFDALVADVAARLRTEGL
ncbi:mycofactocin biosynthesis peptidyl-dipeptidase MftE [Streptomyces sp. NPDC057257]|uniref:mycofactocin biosynthesis peptidyl-dipeptidase MftE n=1 Tax=Streptomyces sp. NPDC057257 TaxID=3346071 RepID=UPI0036298571